MGFVSVNFVNIRLVSPSLHGRLNLLKGRAQ
jgi:hypothetical protein